jgi:peptidyl-prolyl cis-trans isomerase C
MIMNDFRLVLAAVLLSAVGGYAASAPLFEDTLLAKGNGVEVRRSQLDDAFIAYKANLAVRGQNIPEERRLQAEAQLLDRLIVAQLLVSKATAADKSKAREKADKFLEETKKTAGTDEAYYRQLKVLGITPVQFTNRVVEQAVAEELLLREIKSKIIIEPPRIEQFYATNDAAFRQPEIARAKHILVLTRDPRTRMELSPEQKTAKREKALKVLARAKKGEDFDKLIEECSEDPLLKDNKGEFRFTRAKDDPRRAMLIEFETAAFAMKPGEISNLVPTEYGFHIIKLIEITPARKLPLTEVSDKIKDRLNDQEAEKQLPDYFAKLKKEAGVVIVDEKFRTALEELQKNSPR